MTNNLRDNYPTVGRTTTKTIETSLKKLEEQLLNNLKKDFPNR